MNYFLGKNNTVQEEFDHESESSDFQELASPVDQIMIQEYRKNKMLKEFKECVNAVDTNDTTYKYIQEHRKTKMLKEFKNYVNSADDDTVYAKHILDTEIRECYKGKKTLYFVKYDSMFDELYESEVTHKKSFMSFFMNLCIFSN